MNKRILAGFQTDKCFKLCVCDSVCKHVVCMLLIQLLLAIYCLH